jgi:hypothetical protein
MVVKKTVLNVHCYTYSIVVLHLNLKFHVRAILGTAPVSVFPRSLTAQECATFALEASLQCYQHCTRPASCRGDTVPSCVCTYCIASLQYACSNWHHLFYTYCYFTKLKLFTTMLLGSTTASVITQIHNALNVSFGMCVFIYIVQFTPVSLIVLVQCIHREIWTYVARGSTFLSHGCFRRGKD